MAKKARIIEVAYEHEPGPDSEQRLTQAFDMLFEAISIGGPEVIEEVENKKLKE